MKLLICLIITLTLTACVSMTPEQRIAYCNTTNAFQAGKIDGQKDNNPQVNYARHCHQKQNQINRAYLRGYRYAMRNRIRDGRI